MADQELLSARVARRLREARIRAGMTVREVGACLDVDHTLIVRYERGTVEPSLDRLDALARTYQLTAAALLAAHDEAMPAFVALDRASAAQVALALAGLGEGKK